MDTKGEHSRVHPHAQNLIASIYYLLEAETFSTFHRLSSDEIWHHYRGSPVAIEVIDADGAYAPTLDAPVIATPAGV